ncbi:MAG: hypothetical protein P8M05_01730 [Flavobacteriales bacterium]|nr:hypothetical protein [Flavobacteriales bacterium]
MFTAFLISIQTFLKRTSNVLVALVKVVFLSKWFVKLPPIKMNEIAVLANGPSLEKDLKSLHQKSFSGEYMCVNYFPSSNKFTEIKPKFVVFCDASLFTTTANHRLYSDNKTVFSNIYSKTTWPIYLFVPYSSKKNFLKLVAIHQLSNSNVHYTFYNTTNFNGNRGIFHSFYNKQLGMPDPRTVVTPCVMLSINMGFKKVFLTGVDHNFHEGIKLDQDNKLLISIDHFYDENEDRKYVPFKNPVTDEVYKMGELFEVLQKIFNSYGYIAKFAKKKDVQVLNCTETSFIDEFIKIK